MPAIIPHLPGRDDQADQEHLLEDGHELDNPLGEAGEQKQGPDPGDHAVSVTGLRRSGQGCR
jgi:hypothetical protein